MKDLTESSPKMTKISKFLDHLNPFLKRLDSYASEISTILLKIMNNAIIFGQTACLTDILAEFQLPFAKNFSCFYVSYSKIWVLWGSVSLVLWSDPALAMKDSDGILHCGSNFRKMPFIAGEVLHRKLL